MRVSIAARRPGYLVLPGEMCFRQQMSLTWQCVLQIWPPRTREFFAIGLARHPTYTWVLMVTSKL